MPTREFSGWASRVVLAACAIIAWPLSAGFAASAPQAPATLADTGLYSSFERLEIDPSNLAFAPQYALWTDGASKRRWISLPPGTAIDASDPEAWVFPTGTRFWKEFSFGERQVETRYIEHLPDGGWLYAAYEWSKDGRTATLAPDRGRGGAYALVGGRSHTIPAASDCRVCHESGRTPVLGFSLLQLSPDRDPGALHAEPRPTQDLDLEVLVRAGLLVGLPEPLLARPPRIAAATPVERAALGYLHANCGHCHNDEGPLRTLGLGLRHRTDVDSAPGVATTVGAPIRKRAPGQSPEAVFRIDPGQPDRSGLAQRMGSRWAALQMPPLGSNLVDEQALELVRQWITGMESLQAQTKGEGRKQ